MAEKKEKAITLFDDQPIDNWLAIIKKEAGKDEKKERALKVAAKKSLTVKNMAEYIMKHDNTPEAKAAFKAASYTPKKDKKTGEVELDENDNVVEVQSVIKAATYFIDKYIPDLKLPELPKETKFDLIADW